MVPLPPWGSQGQDCTSRWERVGHSESHWDPQWPARVRGEQTRVQMGGIGRESGVRDEDTGWNGGGGATGAEGPPRGFGRWGQADEGWGPGGEAGWRDLFRAQPVPQSHRVTGETLRSRCPGPPTSMPGTPWALLLPKMHLLVLVPPRIPQTSWSFRRSLPTLHGPSPVLLFLTGRSPPLPVASPCLPDLECLWVCKPLPGVL